jgi:hypothetical protein
VKALCACFFYLQIICSERLFDSSPLVLISATNGVVIATEKKLPSILVDDASVRFKSVCRTLSSRLFLSTVRFMRRDFGRLGGR